MGATLVLAPRETLLSPTALAELIREQRVSYVGAPPAMLELVEPGPYPHLRNVLVGGEAYSGELVNRWNLPGRKFINGYGPTEAAIGCTAYHCEQITWRSSPPSAGRCWAASSTWSTHSATSPRSEYPESCSSAANTASPAATSTSPS